MIPQWKPYIFECPVTVDTNAYTAADVVGGSTSGYITSSSPLPQGKGGGYIAWIRLVDDSAANAGNSRGGYTIYVYDNAPSAIADDAANAPTEADYLKCLGRIVVLDADYDTSGSEADMAIVAGKDTRTGEYIMFDNLDAGKLYFRLVCTGAVTYADANDLTVDVCVMLM